MFNIKKISLITGSVFIFTILFSIFAPIKFTTSGLLIKNNDIEHISMNADAQKYIEKNNIKKLNININKNKYHAHIEYSEISFGQVFYSCWLEEDDQVEFGVYNLNCCLGEIKLWAIFLRSF